MEDVKILVNGFYVKVFADELLAPIFHEVVRAEEWTGHLQKMYSFWGTFLQFENDYEGNAYAMHFPLPIDERHFDRWEQLFNETMDEHFQGEKVDFLKENVKRMSNTFVEKIAKKKRPNEKDGDFISLI